MHTVWVSRVHPRSRKLNQENKERPKFLSLWNNTGFRFRMFIYKAYAPSLASIHSASLSSLHSNQLLRNETGPDHTNDGLSFQDPSRNADGFDGQFSGPAGLKSYGAALVEANGSEADVSKLYVNHGQPQEPLLFQGNIINHLYATNPYDGRSPIHRAVECTEKNAGLTIVNLLLKTDSEIANLQDRDGFSPLHLACQLDRKKIVKKLLNLENVNLNLRTLDGRLPEEMTSTPSVQKLLKKARQNTLASPSGTEEDVRLGRAVSEISQPTVQSTIDFEKLNKRFMEEKTKGATTL